VKIFSCKIFRGIVSIHSFYMSQPVDTSCLYKSNYIFFFNISSISSLFLILHCSSCFSCPYIFLIVFL
jgi:hypothetical protein